MNLLEHYIEEIISEEEVNHNGENFVVAKVKVNCYGNVNVDEHITSKRMWEEEKLQGYYMA